MSGEYAVIGRRLPRHDAVHKVTGEARYVDDIKLPGMLYGALLRSPYPSARIKAIDASAARALAGVKVVLTGADVADRRTGYRNDNAALHRDRVRCISDAVAAVAAVDRATAHAALDLIKVEYEQLPGVFDPEEAMRDDAPLVHEESWLDPAGRQRVPRNSNVSLHFKFEHGDPDRALQECDVVVEERFTVPLVTSCTIEPSSCIAHWDAAGALTMYSPTQAPHLYQREMADALGISGGQVRVIGTLIGGAFGKNLEAHTWDIACALLARAAGRPVKLTFSRIDEFIASRPRQPHIMYVKAGAKKDGRLWVRTCAAILDNGAYNSWGALTPMVTMQTFTSFYKVPHSRYDCKVVYTNNLYSGSMRGYGNPEAMFAVEQTMDMLADKLGMDPVEFRLQNANEPGEVTPQGMQLQVVPIKECIEKVAAGIGYREKRGKQRDRLRGVGIAGVLHVAGGARIYKSDGCGMIVKVDDFGKVTLLSGGSDMGQGGDMTMAMIVAEELGVEAEDVRVISRDTAIVPWDVGVHASRATFVAGNAARLAARDAKRQILAAAAAMLGADADELDIRRRFVYVKADPAKRVAYDKVVRALHFRQQGNVVIGHAFYDPPTEMQDSQWRGNVSASWGFGAQAAEVSVDARTGQVRVERIVAAHDVGQAINPTAVEGQIDGGVMMGVGYALSEQMKLSRGQVINTSLRDYGMLTAEHAPAVERIIVEAGDPEGPFGAKGMAEATTVPTAAAIANAVADAIGVHINSLPITPEKVLQALKQKQAQTAPDSRAVAASEAEGE